VTAVNVGAAYVELGVKYDDTMKKVGDDITGLNRTAERTALQVGEHFTRGFGTVRTEATRTAEDVGKSFSSSITRGIGEAFSGISSHLGEVGSAASSTFSGLTSGAGEAALGVAGIGAAAVAVGKQLYDLGQSWDTITDNITIRTGLTGSALDKITESVKRVGSESAASLEQIAGIESQLTSILHLTGGTLDEVTLKLADLQELTGDTVNIRQLGQLFHGFNVDTTEMGDNIDKLYDAFTRTQIPVSEMVTMLRDAGPVARVLNIDIGQMAGLLVTLNDAGIEPTQTLQGLRVALANLSKERPPKGVLGDFLKDEEGKDVKTKLEDLITRIHETRNIDLARSVFGRGWSQIYDAITNDKLNADDFAKSMVTTGNTIDKTRKATEDWNEQLQKSWNTLKSDLAPAATAVFDAISHSIEGAINLLDSFTTKVSSMPVPGVTPGAQLPGVNLPTGPYAQPPGVNAPGIPGLPSAGANQGLGGATAEGVPLTPGQQQGLMRGTATPGMIQWQVYDPATGKWTIKEQPKPVVPEPKPPPAPPPELPPPTSELDTSGGAKAASKALPQAPSLPYNTALPPGFLQLPQTTALLSAESGFIDARHDVEEKRARVDQLEQEGVGNENDIQNARNDLYQAQVRQQQAELKLYDARATMFDKENKRVDAQNKKIEDETKKYESQFSGGSLIDFLLYLIFQPGIDAIRQKIHAPELAAAQASSLTSGLAGGEPSTTTAQLPSFTSLFTGNLSTPQGIAAGGARTAALYSLAQSLQGTPYSQALRNDCSGTVAQLAAAAAGLPIPSAGERFTTVNEGEKLAEMGFQPGIGPPGSFRVGWNPAPGNAGHTAATLPGGQNIEQGGSNNTVTIGAGAQGFNAPFFTQHAYLPMSPVSAPSYPPLTPQQLVNPALTPWPLPGMQGGGQVPGWGGGDQYPILTEGGEWVVPKDKAQQHAETLQAITSGANNDQILQALADQAPGGQHLPPGGPLPIGPTGDQLAAQAQAVPKTGRTGGYIPSGAGASGQASGNR